MINKINKDLIYPLIYLLVLVLVLVVMVKIVAQKYSQQRSLLGGLRRTENVLQDKLSLLNEYQNDLPSYVLKLTTALPEKNPALIIVSQINRLQSENVVQVSDLKINLSAQTDKKINSLQFSFSVDGDFSGLMAFLTALSKSLPLVILDKIELTKSGDNFSADIKTVSYWQAFPEKIPSTTAGIKKLTKEEVNLLANLMTLNSPIFSTVSPQGPSTRVNPFQ